MDSVTKPFTATPLQRRSPVPSDLNIAQAADASVSYTIKLVSRKQSMVSQSVVTAAKGKLA